MNADIENLLNKWYDAKQEISMLEKKIEKYKEVAENIMNKTNSDVLSSSKYNLSKKDIKLLKLLSKMHSQK